MATGNRAAVTLPSDTQILITREFEAPKHLVYRAWTTPELIKRWWHANRGTMTSCDVDLRVGGRWRYVMDARGHEVGFHGTYRVIVPNERLEYTEVYEGVPDADDSPAFNTVKFEERGGRTFLTCLVDAGTRQVRDAIIESGMEDGMQDAMTLLEEVAAGLR